MCLVCHPRVGRVFMAYGHMASDLDFPRTTIKTDCSASLVESAIKHPENKVTDGKRKFDAISPADFYLNLPQLCLVTQHYLTN